VKGMTQAQPLEAITADGNHFLKFFMNPDGKVVIQDVQNNTASVVGPGVEVGNVMLYGIDKVLLSGEQGPLNAWWEAQPEFITE